MPNPISTYTKTAFEIFEEINNMKTADERVQALKKESNKDIIADLLVYAFNDHIKERIILPDSVPPVKESEQDTKGMYLPAKEESAPSSLSRMVKDLTRLVATPKNPRPNFIKMEKMYFGVLESIHPKDAELVANIMARSWPYKKISMANVKEARPDLLRKPDWLAA